VDGDPITDASSIIPHFDYTMLDGETRIVIQQRTSEIKERVRQSAGAIRDIGVKLTEIRDQLSHGQFLAWAHAEFPSWSERTLYNFISVGARFKSANFADLVIATSALYLLSAPSTSEAARLEAMERAKSGEAITYTTARQLVQRHRPVPMTTSALEPNHDLLDHKRPVARLPIDQAGDADAGRYRLPNDATDDEETLPFQVRLPEGTAGSPHLSSVTARTITLNAPHGWTRGRVLAILQVVVAEVEAGRTSPCLTASADDAAILLTANGRTKEA
jgi:hypothetical protein